MNTRFTQKARNVLTTALDEARRLGHTYVGSEHILLGLSSETDSAVSRILIKNGIVPDRMRASVISISGKGNVSSVGADDMTPCVKKIIEESHAISSGHSQSYIGTEHILLALLNEKNSVAIKILETCDVKIEDIKNEILSFIENGNERFTKNNSMKNTKNDTKQVSVLSGYGRDLTEAARLGKIDPVIGRDEETARLIQVLSRRIKNNPCLIGEPGVGKTAVVEGLARRIASRDVPENLIGKSIISLDLCSMVAGAKYRGEFEERMKNILKEVAKRPEIILFVDELHTIIGAGAAEGAVDAANIIKPALARGEMQMIGATTLEEYRRHIERDSALERRFQPITVAEPTVSDAESILFGLRDKYESHHKLKISDEAIRASVSLSDRYISDRFLPDKALDVIDETAARVRITNSTLPPVVRSDEEELASIMSEKEEAIISQDFERAAELRDKEHRLRAEYEKRRDEWNTELDENVLTVTVSDVAETVSQWTGIPIGEINSDESNRLLTLEAKLKERVIGQDHAIKAVSSAIARGRVGLSDPHRPIGSFIFLGSTGVGKTELAAAVAETVYGSKTALIRLDMSEFMEKHSVSKLIGSPPGYIGYDDGGLLTERVRRNPYSLVLFDEIEKAHPDIFNILLQILDDGKLTDSKGRVCNFKNTVIILTSNIGSDEPAGKLLGFTAENAFTRTDKGMSALKKVFSAEFLNRIDEVVYFSPLSDESLVKIAKNILRDLALRAKSLGVELIFEDGVAEFAASVGKDEKYGARPLKRTVTSLIGNEFSKLMIKGQIKNGDTVSVYVDGENIKLKKA